MSDDEPDDRRLEPVSAICLALPEATVKRHRRHASFRVRERGFAWFLADHHGDGIVAVACKTPAGEAAALIESEPGRFYRPAYLGAQGWVGLRLDRGEVDWTEVAELVTESYLLVAPKRLAALVDEP